MPPEHRETGIGESELRMNGVTPAPYSERSLVMTPEVLTPHFSSEIAGRSSCCSGIGMKKASRKGLAFNAFNSGGRIRTSDLRVMSPTSYQAALPRDLCDASYYVG